MFKRIIVSLLLCTSAALATTSGNPMPLPNERLDNPIVLSGVCSDVKIIESRGRKVDVDKLNAVCNKVVDGFPKYIKHMNGEVDKTKPSYTVSIIPDGHNHRDLNDQTDRFAGRIKHCNGSSTHCTTNLDGFTSFKHHHIFIGNNEQIINTFAHEMFHELSQESGLYDTYKDPAMDERLAEDFARWLGY